MTTIWHKYEVPRKTLHSSIGLGTLYLYRHGATGPQIIRVILPSLIVVTTADIIRFNNAPFARLYERLLGPLMRPSEKHGWNGVIWYMLGVITVLYFYPDDIGALSICLLSWCDTAASIIGRSIGHYGPRLRKGKSLIGSLAALVTGALTTFYFFGSIAPHRLDNSSWSPNSSLGLWGVSLLGGLIASFSEYVDIFSIDDNLLIPVVSGQLLYMTLITFGLGA